MITNNNLNMLIIILLHIIRKTLAVSYNQPTFCSLATWNPNATTFADRSQVGSKPSGIFVNSNNTVYAVNWEKGAIQIWINDTINPTRTISDGLSFPSTLFVTTNGDIYVGNGAEKGRIDKYTLSANHSIFIIPGNSQCLGLFIDVNDTLYCSMIDNHQVVKKGLNENTMALTTVAGTGSANSASNTLNQPTGIFVDINFDLYVADQNNDRIQLFRLGQLNGITVAGSGSLNTTITLNRPSGIVLDADKYLFIADQGNHRIIGSGPHGFRCLVGCNDSALSESNQLNFPVTLSFDSKGNLFVLDALNDRIQKFLLATNSCDETMTTQALSVSTTEYVTSSTALNLETSTTTLSSEPESTSNALSLVSKTGLIEFTTTPVLLVKTTSTVKTTDKPPPKHFNPLSCADPSLMGPACNVSSFPCKMDNPCRNNGTCWNNDAEPRGYVCSCAPGFNGIKCELNRRLCKPGTCWNNGQCNEPEDGTFNCTCEPGWHDIHCQKMVNYCEKVICMNKGVCRPLFRHFKCECGYGYSGDHCEITSNKLTVYKIVSKSFAYVAIIAMVLVALFIVIMDILKYFFGIDPVFKELQRIRRDKRLKKQKPLIQRFIYVHLPPTSKEPLCTAAEKTV